MRRAPFCPLICCSFINHYIFPGGYLPSITQLLNHISEQSQGTLIVENVENIGGHYAKTLRLWKENFMESFDDKIRPALMREHPDMTPEGVEVFRKKWEVRHRQDFCAFTETNLLPVLLHVLRGWFCDQDSG